MTEQNIPPVPPPEPNPTGAAESNAYTTPPGGAMNYATPAGAPYAGPAPSKDATNMALLSHLLGILIGFLGPLLIWLLKKEDHPFIEDQSREALNFQLTLLVAYVIGGVTACVFIGFFIILAAWICAVIFGILGTIKASRGEAYRYPFNIRFIK